MTHSEGASRSSALAETLCLDVRPRRLAVENSGSGKGEGGGEREGKRERELGEREGKRERAWGSGGGGEGGSLLTKRGLCETAG